VDDILDTGKTLSRVLPKIRALKPRRIKTCVLLDKATRRVEKIEADYVGFEIPIILSFATDWIMPSTIRNLAVRRRAASADF